MSYPCGCPAGFSRCAGRCLARLNQAVTFTKAESLCAELGAHLAVPRSEAENQCAMKASPGEMSWLGVTDVVTEGQFIGADGCGFVEDPAWGDGQPTNSENRDFVVLLPPSDSEGPGWADKKGRLTKYPLCQLALCYQPDCQ